MTVRAFDVAIIGGGLVGAAIAFGLGDLGARLVVVDEGDVAHRAARGNFGLVWVQGKGAGMPAYGAWTQQSAREWPRLAAAVKGNPGSGERPVPGEGWFRAAADAGLDAPKRLWWIIGWLPWRGAPTPRSPSTHTSPNGLQHGRPTSGRS